MNSVCTPILARPTLVAQPIWENRRLVNSGFHAACTQKGGVKVAGKTVLGAGGLQSSEECGLAVL